MSKFIIALIIGIIAGLSGFLSWYSSDLNKVARYIGAYALAYPIKTGIIILFFVFIIIELFAVFNTVGLIEPSLNTYGRIAQRDLVTVGGTAAMLRCHRLINAFEITGESDSEVLRNIALTFRKIAKELPFELQAMREYRKIEFVEPTQFLLVRIENTPYCVLCVAHDTAFADLKTTIKEFKPTDSIDYSSLQRYIPMIPAEAIKRAIDTVLFITERKLEYPTGHSIGGGGGGAYAGYSIVLCKSDLKTNDLKSFLASALFLPLK